jgi:hypothetical protein
MLIGFEHVSGLKLVAAVRLRLLRSLLARPQKYTSVVRWVLQKAVFLCWSKQQEFKVHDNMGQEKGRFPLLVCLLLQTFEKVGQSQSQTTCIA